MPGQLADSRVGWSAHSPATPQNLLRGHRRGFVTHRVSNQGNQHVHLTVAGALQFFFTNIHLPSL